MYLVEFNSPPDNRLTSEFNEAFLITLDLIETKLPKGVVITTSAIDKFYSNGLQISDLGDPGVRSAFFSRSLFPLLARLLRYVVPPFYQNVAYPKHPFQANTMLIRVLSKRRNG